MAERKVSGKSKKNITQASADASARRSQQSEYDAFVSQFGPDLRRRVTKTVPEPKKTRVNADEFTSARCGEINPRTTTNPAAEHQIFTKRTGRVVSDDTGFRGTDYNDRFALKPEMPELEQTDGIVAQGGFDDASVPGQQTMADLVSSADSVEEIVVPVESKISNEENAFELAYRTMRSESGVTFGKSEKLRAIARTAADDAGMAPDSQLAFPAFSPLFKFPDDDKKGKGRIRKKEKKHKKNEQQPAVFDIDESEIVTSHSPQMPESESLADNSSVGSLDKKHRAKRIFETINNAGLKDSEPHFEMNSKSDVSETLKKLRKTQFIDFIKTFVLLVAGIASGVVSLIASKPETTANLLPLLIIFLVISGAVCIKELADGIKDILKLKLSYSFGSVVIYALSLIQTFVAAIASSDNFVYGLAPSAIFMLMFVTVPKMLLTDNMYSAVKMFDSEKGVSLFKPLSESGIEGAVKSKSDDDKQIRYSVKTDFATGLIKKLDNAIPAPFAGNIMFIFGFVFALILSIAAGIKSGSFALAVTVFDAVVICCIPVSYTLCAAVLLLLSNKKLAKKRSSIISYKSAQDVAQTKAVVFNDCDIIEASSCCIHGAKFFGSTDPRKVSLCCAAVMNSADMPLYEIMKSIIEQSEDEIPVADDYILTDKGVAAIYNGKKILLGTKEFLTENHVCIPDEDFDGKYITGSRKLLYLSVNGEFSMLLIVSYHVKRSVAKFFKYLAKKNLNIIFYSCDPNISAEFIEKKCRLNKGTVVRLNETETAYFKDKNSKSENTLPAQVFTDGKISSVEELIKNSYYLTACINALPLIIFALSGLGALAVAVPVLTGSFAVVGNLYIMAVKLVGLFIGIGVPVIAFKEK